MDDVDGWLDSLFDELLFELELEEAEGWVNGLAQFRDAEIIPKNSAEKTPEGGDPILCIETRDSRRERRYRERHK